MDVLIDTETTTDAGFDGNLIRPVETQPSGELRYVDPNSIVGGTLGQMGVLYIGGKNFRLDARSRNIVVSDGTENVITIGKLPDGTFGIDVADGKIEGAWIVAKSITADQIQADTITADEIEAGTITTTEIAANTITAANIAADTITSTEIKAGTIVASDIAASTITADKLTISTLSAITANLGTITAGSISGTSITLPYEALADAGKLRWVNDNNKIWTDSNQYMGFKSAGGRFYWYANGNLQFYLDTSGTYSYDHTYIGTGQDQATANLYVGYGDSIQYLYLNGALTFSYDGLTSTANNTLQRYGNSLYYQDNSGTSYTIDMTPV